ncbi:hypothetical protein INR49_030698 [Caranx melampygus]|nr:hypothetical protein INR49_030698 [Caranx melampygus]
MTPDVTQAPREPGDPGLRWSSQSRSSAGLVIHRPTDGLISVSQVYGDCVKLCWLHMLLICKDHVPAASDFVSYIEVKPGQRASTQHADYHRKCSPQRVGGPGLIGFTVALTSYPTLALFSQLWRSSVSLQRDMTFDKSRPTCLDGEHMWDTEADATLDFPRFGYVHKARLKVSAGEVGQEFQTQLCQSVCVCAACENRLKSY